MSEGLPLSRFRIAQDENGTFERALSELRGGHKLTHWMWFVFPQLEGLGHSAMARTYAIRSLGEARRYLQDPILGARLRECAAVLNELHGLSARDIFGATDAMKLRSSMTLFVRAAPQEAAFAQVLGAYFEGTADPATDALLSDLSDQL